MVVLAGLVDSCPVPVSTGMVASCKWVKKLGARGPRRPHPPFNSTENFLSLSSSRVFQPHFGRPSKPFPLSSSTPNNLRLPPPEDAASRDSGSGPDHHESVIPPLARPSPDSRAGTPKERRVGARLAVRRAIISHMVRILHLPPPAPSTKHFPSITMMTQSNVFYSN